MCGIAGFIGFQDDTLIRQFSRELAHRGPDGEGIYTDSDVTLLNRRLAIIDRAGGDQPIYNEDRSVVVVYNGEIYNYQELRTQLEKAGHHFKTKSDTEIIVHGYEEWGESAFDRYNGMFGVALYDLKRKKLILARDHFGIKPLYYTILPFEGRVRMLFSSELKPLIHSGLIHRAVNERVLYRYLAFRVHDDGHETFFQGVERLLPGELMIVENGRWVKKVFSTLTRDLASQMNARQSDASDIEQNQKFQTLFTDSVKSRLVSEVPVGTCLSGGLDSSLVVATVNTLLKDHSAESASVGSVQNTFSAVFPGSVNDEERYIDTLLAQCDHIQSHKICPKPQEFITDLSDFIKTQEEPTISTGPYAQYRVMQMAHKKVTVLLDGQGADEMLAGYIPYVWVYLRQLWREKNIVTLLSEIVMTYPLLQKSLIRQIQSRLKRFGGSRPYRVIHPSFAKQFSRERFTVCQDHLKKRLADDIFKNSLQSLLRYEDRNTMRFSIEGRVPFLDLSLVRFIFSLPDRQIIRHGYNKFILRESARTLLPDLIRLRKNKIGFTTPEHEWFLALKKEIYEIFLSESFANRPYVNQKEVLRAFREFTLGKNDDTLVFWRLINMELWLREFIDPVGQGVSGSATQPGSDSAGQRLSDSVPQQLSRAAPQRLSASATQPGSTSATQCLRDAGLQGLRNSGSQSMTANTGKRIEIKVEGKSYARYPVRTGHFEKGDQYGEKIAEYVGSTIARLGHTDNVIDSNTLPNQKKWYVVVSEKIVAISQGRSFFIWDIKPSWIANLLSDYVVRTPQGIGLGSPWTMQIAIEEAGLMRILLATAASLLTKPWGMKGVFYRVAGHRINAIDGPTEYSLYPSNVSAKLPPKDPQRAAQGIDREVRKRVSDSAGQHLSTSATQPGSTSAPQRLSRAAPQHLSDSVVQGVSGSARQSGQLSDTRESSSPSSFGGVVIIDANDIGRNVLGNTTDKPNRFFEDVMRDNPMGQGSEQTPLVIVI